MFILAKEIQITSLILALEERNLSKNKQFQSSNELDMRSSAAILE